jgi:hypothetical protein
MLRGLHVTKEVSPIFTGIPQVGKKSVGLTL